MSDPQIMWQVWEESDMTEGRGPMRATDKVFATKQEAWDYVNDRGGVMGRRPGINCYPMDKCKALGIKNWQQMVDLLGASYSDYDVRPVEAHVRTPEAVADLRQLLAELDEPTTVEDLRVLLVELEEEA